MSGFDPGESQRQFAERLNQRIHERINDRMERRYRRRHSGVHGLILGSILAGVGVLFLLQNLGIIYVYDVWQYWPAILIVLGISRAATAYGWASRISGGVLAFAGTIFLLHTLDIIHGNVWNYFWPLILICAGIGMLARGMERQHRWNWDWNSGANPSAGTGAGTSAGTGTAAGGHPAANGDDARTLAPIAIFSGVKRRIVSQEFEGGEAMAFFGGITLDLRQAATKKSEIVIETSAVFGGIEMRVPESWTVIVRGAAIFGGYEDKTVHTSSATGNPRLIITGIAVFGGVSVKN